MKNPPLTFSLPATNYGQQKLDNIINHVLRRDQRICQMCGADESCLCPYQKEPIALFVRFINLGEEGGLLHTDNLRTICSTCADGLSAIARRPSSDYSNRTIRLTIGHIVDKSKGGEDVPSNLRAVCSNCNEGLQNAAPIKPDRLQLLAQIRRATLTDQREVLEWLLQKFNFKAIPNK